MIRDVGYIINTHITYRKPLDVLLDSMRYIPRVNIKIVVAGSPEYHTTIIDNYAEMIYVPHNSFDYTGAIELVRAYKSGHTWQLPDHIFFVQDTMEFGFNTDYFIRKAHSDAWCTAAFGGQCNLVLYRYDFLLGNESFIMAQQNLSKLESVHQEGALWKNAPPNKRSTYDNAHCYVVGEGTPYSNIPRIKEYYTAIDVIKWKANYGQNTYTGMIVHP